MLAGGGEAEPVVGGGGGVGRSGAGGVLSVGWPSVAVEVAVSSPSPSSVPSPSVESGVDEAVVGSWSAARVAVAGAVGTPGFVAVDGGVGRGLALVLGFEGVDGALVGRADGDGGTEPDPEPEVVLSAGSLGTGATGCGVHFAAAADAATDGRWECSDCGSARSDTTSVTAANPTPVTPSSGMKRLGRPLRFTCTSVVMPGLAAVAGPSCRARAVT